MINLAYATTKYLGNVMDKKKDNIEYKIMIL